MPDNQESLDMRRISNSEVIAWNTCERRYYYEHDLKLEPVSKSESLSIGTLGHEILATYYSARKSGQNHPTAVVTARGKLQSYLANVSLEYSLELVLKVDRILMGYWEIAALDNYEIMHVEDEFDIPLTDDFEFVMKLDLLVRDLRSGEIILIDHKFVYDFWTEDAMQLNPQFPKYIGALRFQGVPVSKAILNQIRYRTIKEPTQDQLFKRAVYKPSDAKVRNALREQVIASRRIWQHRQLPLEQRAANALRILNKQVCRSCGVKSLCMSEFDGGDITLEVQLNYKTNTYDYNREEADLL